MVKRIAKPGPKLRYMKDQEFEDEAALFLAEYSQQHVAVTAPPIPIDDIVAGLPSLSVFYKDLRKEFGVDDVLGALWVNKRQVDIDLGLVPEDNPSMLGRYHFTLAHEAGHWRLHRHLFQKKANQLRLLPDGVERPEYICRSSDTDRIEVSSQPLRLLPANAARDGEARLARMARQHGPDLPRRLGGSLRPIADRGRR